MAAKTSWHRYWTKLRDCHRMYIWLIFGMEVSCILYYKEIGVSPTSLWNFVLNCGLKIRKFRHGESDALSTIGYSSSSSSSTVELVDDTYRTIDESWLFTTSRSTVTLQLYYCDLLWICCTVYFYSWQDFDWRSASRGPSAVAQFLVFVI